MDPSKRSASFQSGEERVSKGGVCGFLASTCGESPIDNI